MKYLGGSGRYLLRILKIIQYDFIEFEEASFGLNEHEGG